MNCPSLGTLHAYAAEDNYQGCEECLNRGDDVNSMAQDPLNPSSPAGETPLHIAARYGRYNIFMLLLNHGGDRSVKNAAGQTPLDVCSEQFRIQVQSALRPKKAPPKRLAPPSAPPMRAQGNTSDLPKGWIFARDRRTGRPYYIHLPTRTSQWEKPRADQTDGAIDYMKIKKPSKLSPQEIEEQFKYVEDILTQRKSEIDLQQEQLDQIDKQLEVQKRLELIKTGQPNWQISYNEIEILNKVGEGSHGEVFKGKWRGTYVAIKTLKGIDASDPCEVSTFSKTVCSLRALQHPGIVLFLGACTSPAMCHVTEFMEGGCLFNLIHKKKHVPNANKRISICRDVALALSYLHSCKPPIVHGNLKSTNVLLDVKQEHAKICDIGFKMSSEDKSALLGAAPPLLWTAPETADGTPHTPHDVYSFGMIVFELCSGKLPFFNIPIETVHENVLRGERPPLKMNIPEKWRSLIESCWAQDPSQRPSAERIVDRIAEL